MGGGICSHLKCRKTKSKTNCHSEKNCKSVVVGGVGRSGEEEVKVYIF